MKNTERILEKLCRKNNYERKMSIDFIIEYLGEQLTEEFISEIFLGNKNGNSTTFSNYFIVNFKEEKCILIFDFN